MKKFLIGFITGLTISSSSFALTRVEVVKQYLDNLQNKNAQNMQELFIPEGYVISTSKGKIKAEQFFNAFLPALSSSQIQLTSIFRSVDNKDHLAARFHFSYILKDGEKGSGEYIDDFAFAKNSSKLESVHMFENLK